MNALVKKEIRLLLPGFLMGVALSLANWFLKAERLGYDDFAFFISFVFCGAIAVFMALNAFGAEISAGTFSMLLAQPVSRHRIWQTKAWLLAAALFSAGFLWCAILWLRLELFKVPVAAGYCRDTFALVGLFLVVIYSGALWSVLLLRQVAAAFWFTLLTPGALLVLITGLWPQKYAAAEEPAVIAALLIYSAAGIWFARRLFLRAQDVAWTGGTIALPEMRGLKWWGERPREPQTALDIGSSGASPHRTWRPRAALAAKEFQLHQSQLIMAGALALLHLGVLAARKFGSFQKNSSLEFVLESFWLLWLVMPLLVGCAAAAEERKMGTLEGQLCLPVKRRTLFAVKIRMVLMLSVLFGLGLPLLLEGARILPDLHYAFNPLKGVNGMAYLVGWQEQPPIPFAFFWFCFYQLEPLLPVLAQLGLVLAIGLISFYASTLARNTLQALAPAALGILLAGFLVVMNQGSNFFGVHLPWRGGLIYWIGGPALAVALAALARHNSQRMFLGGPVWRQNALALLAVLGLIAAATSAIYHRAWEKLTPFEPSHGAARLSRANPPVLHEQWDALSVRLPDGRIWTDYFAMVTRVWNPLALYLGDLRLISLGQGHFLGGSNWVSMVYNGWQEQVGIKTDGSLWVSATPRRTVQGNGRWQVIEAGAVVRYGSETNWSSVVQEWPFMLLVKTDGTLWRWGSRNRDIKYNDWPGLTSYTPQRIGVGTNWAEVFQANRLLCFRKTDGSLWIQWSGNHEEATNRVVEHEHEFTIERAPLLTNRRWHGYKTDSSEALNYYLGVFGDGSFRIWADMQWNQNPRKGNGILEWKVVDRQFGRGTNWLDVAGQGGKVVTLKDDGTLWLWNFYRDGRSGWDPGRDERRILGQTPVRLGIHSDWVGIANADGGVISLAADGSLWFWPLDRAGAMGRYNDANFYDQDTRRIEPLLDVSRKPQRLGNLFSRAN